MVSVTMGTSKLRSHVDSIDTDSTEDVMYCTSCAHDELGASNTQDLPTSDDAVNTYICATSKV